MASSTASRRSSGICLPPVPSIGRVGRVRGRPSSPHGALALRFVECQVYDATVDNRYGADILSGDWRVPRNGRARETEAELGLVVEDVETGWCGAVVSVEKAGGMQVVHLEDRRGRSKGFPLGPGFLLDGSPVILTLPTSQATAAREAAQRARAETSRTASGSRAVVGVRARVASGSRIFDDNSLDLRIEGVVVEMLDGVDDLAAVICDFQPGSGRR